VCLLVQRHVKKAGKVKRGGKLFGFISVFQGGEGENDQRVKERGLGYPMRFGVKTQNH